jgi:hypothetical protein
LSLFPSGAVKFRDFGSVHRHVQPSVEGVVQPHCEERYPISFFGDVFERFGVFSLARSGSNPVLAEEHQSATVSCFFDAAEKVDLLQPGRRAPIISQNPSATRMTKLQLRALHQPLENWYTSS